MDDLLLSMVVRVVENAVEVEVVEVFDVVVDFVAVMAEALFLMTPRRMLDNFAKQIKVVYA